VKKQRKLAAIMFTDIVGYTALMSKDEQNAMQILQKSLDILKPLIEQYNGELLDNIGDGTLSSFPSVVDAVNCALEIQRTIRKESELILRIGIHLGDLVFSGGHVFGDGVNIASRIEPLAPPGGICITEKVYSDLRNKPGIQAVPLGEKKLKNVDRPIKLYALSEEKPPSAAVPEPSVDKETEPAPVRKRSRRILMSVAGIVVAILGLYAIYSRYFAAPSTIPDEGAIKSIAVLPFVNMSADKDQEYFCDGLAEELLNMLAKIEGLRVIARTSSFSFKGKDVKIAIIGKELNVESILEGSVRKAGEKVRITTQLIKVSDNSHLWSETYDRRLDDIFTVQEEISRQVVDALKVTLLAEDESELAGRPTENIQAYDLYLVGLHHLNQRTEVSYQKAVDYFTQAIELEPDFALAYSWLAFTYIRQHTDGNLPRIEATSKAEKAAMKALSIDDQLAEAHAALGHVRDWQSDFTGAEAEIKKAIELNPNFTPSYAVYAHVLGLLGRYKDAENILEQALEIDPLSESVIASLELNSLLMGRFEEPRYHTFYAYPWYGRLEEALRSQKKRVELDPMNGWEHQNLASIYIWLEEYELAEKSLARVRDLSPWLVVYAEYWLYLARGRYTKLLQLAYDLLNKGPDDLFTITLAVNAEMLVGNYEKAITLYERARLNERNIGFPHGLDPWWIASSGRAALVLMANAYFKTGDSESGKKLLAESRAFFWKLREQGLGTPQSYYFEASLNALGGNRQEALASLRKAIDLGWRWHWFARIDPTLELLRDTPEFKEMMAEVDADIARQRQQLKQEGLLE
jgi:adenylate cyclase